MQGMISLADALRIMATTGEGGGFIPFDFTFVTCNLTEETGGKRINAIGAVLAGGPFGKKDSPKNANHYVNGTRNVMLQGKDRPTTIHTLLITEFNGERVIV